MVRGQHLKRLFDLLVSAVGLAVGALPMAVIAVLIRSTLGRPVLFRQERPGLHGEPFTIYKFRTMRDAVDEDGNPLPDEARMTHLGDMLRATSLDELPELWNVLRGDMSLVGPRPLLMEYLPLYSPEQARRHDVRPGITGLSQVEGRNAAPWAERLQRDVWYVDNQSFWLDLKILARTFSQVLRREGISEEGHATRSRFGGDNPPTT